MAAEGGKSMLEADGICKSYYGNQVLSPVSFRLPAGCCIGITGENGSGKSTLLRLLAQIERPDRGDIRWNGTSVLGNRSFLRQHLGYVPQNTELMEELTVRQQLTLWHRACGLNGSLPREVLNLLDLEPLLQKPIRQLSGGMKGRVSIAAALLNRPDILIMDEATAGLDSNYTHRLLDWLEAHLSRGGSILWCSHHPEELERLCNARLVLRDGRQTL